MATTTPNFGWSVPTSTDLVKDGATAIETLGDSIDASLVDLKGGTTGQVLAKNSNTDMDFTWAAPTSGDITGVTAGTGITGGGTSGDVTVSFDQANYGGGQFAAGKNKIINGDFNIWQRGTSFAISANSAYTCDRYLSDSGAMNYTFSRQSFTAGTAPVSGYEGTFFFRALATSGSGGFPKIIQKIEDVRIFAGQTVTLSFWGKASSAISVAPDLIQEFGSGGSSTVYTGSVSTSITTSWARYSITYAVPSISGKTIGTGSSLTVSFNLPNSGTASFDTWGWQLEAGSTATPFQTASGSVAGELALCQRYYWRSTGNAAGYYRLADSGFANTTTDAHLSIQNPVTMRVTPTSVDFSGVFLENYIGAGSKAVTALTINNVSNPLVSTANITVASGLVAGTRYFGFLNNATTAFLGYNAEL
jgi:hypothetical protein